MKMYYIGIDIGSLSCDAVLIDEKAKILATSVVPTGARNQEAISNARYETLTASGIAERDIKATVSTGYGRERVKNRVAAITEITCHARGIQHLLDGIRILIDIGGQDSKAIMMDKEGHVVDFAMNDKCAAGTGRFLEAMARALQVDIKDIGKLDRGATSDLKLSSMCTVFAESEVVSLIADGVEVNEIVKGLNRSIAFRSMTLVKRIISDPNGFPIAMSGGVAHNKGVVRAISDALKTKIRVPHKPDIVGALGAALIARDRAREK